MLSGAWWNPFIRMRIVKPHRGANILKGDISLQWQTTSILFFHEGWGKVAAAGATQYAIDRWNPELFINLGTCGGFEGSVKRFEILLIDKTVIYDIKEAMGDSKEAIQDYSASIDLSWLHAPILFWKHFGFRRSRFGAIQIPSLKENYNAIAGDWETGAIAYLST